MMSFSGYGLRMAMFKFFLFRIIPALVVIVFVVWAFVQIISIGLERQFVVDCYKYQSYERSFADFELEAPLVEECAKVGVKVK